MLYVQAAGKKTIKSISITIGKKKVTKSIYNMKIGKTKSCKVTVKPADTGDKISYKSSNPAAVSVNSKGKITANQTGSAKVTVAVKRAGRKKSTWVKIKVTGGSLESSSSEGSGSESSSLESTSSEGNTPTPSDGIVDPPAETGREII